MLRVRDLFVEITGVCNANCPHCYRLKEEQFHLSEREIMKRLSTVEWRNVFLTGGEPYTHPFINILLKKIKTRFPDRNLCVLSNGSLLAQHIDSIVKYVDVQNISLDVPSKQHDKDRGVPNLFETIKENIKLLKIVDKYDTLKINFLVTMFRDYFDDWMDIIFLANELKINVVFDRYLPYDNVHTEFTPEQLVDIYPILHEAQQEYGNISVLDPLYYTYYPDEGVSRARCKDRLFIGINKKWKLCPFHPTEYNSPDSVLAARKAEPIPRMCWGCLYEPTCHGGCPSRREIPDKSKGLKFRDPMCAGCVQ